MCLPSVVAYTVIMEKSALTDDLCFLFPERRLMKWRMRMADEYGLKTKKDRWSMFDVECRSRSGGRDWGGQGLWSIIFVIGEERRIT
jgi:hypothetical protein